jgi:hypothetical protein
MTAETAENETQPVAPKTARFKLPKGVVTPIELRNHLVEEGIAPETLKPQQMYAWVKSPGKTNPFPVKWYEEDGTVHDEQPGGVLTRPGLPNLEEAVEWYVAKSTQPKATPAAKKAAATEVSNEPEDESDGDVEDLNEEDGVEVEGDDEDLEEAE